MSFLGALADQINNQFSVGENTTTTLDAVIDGQNVKYGALGDLASKFDQSAQRSYVEEGYLRRDPYNTDPKQLEVLLQQPDATILVKKRMFSSVADNFRPDFMDLDEALYFKAIKVLFQNKCRQIATLEKLSKIQKITSAVGDIDNQLMPLIITLSDSITDGLGAGSNLFGVFGNSNPYASADVSSFVKTVDRVRRLYAFSKSSPYTNWITDETNLFQSQFGQGTGVIEITNFSSLNTNSTLSLNNPGTFGFTISDPYESMLITEYDIELALSDATNLFYNRKSFQFGIDSATQIINDNRTALNRARANRGASAISFIIEPNTLLGKRVTATIDSLGLNIPFTYDSSGGTGFPGLGGALGNGVKVPDDYLKGGDVAGFDGLDTAKNNKLGFNQDIRPLNPQSELQIFQALVTAIFNQLSLQANSQNAFQSSNELTNYARRKMRANFAGQLVIQQMDTAHIYISSKSRFDNKLLSGLNNMFTGSGILQNLNNTITDFSNSFGAASTLLGGSGGLPLQAEKSIYVGPEFPNYLWSLMRTQFITEKEGAHVFAGVIESANDNWSDGKFTIDIRGRDNTYYFDQGKINFKPGADNFNGAIYDPMTPFKSKFDSITGTAKDKTPELLEENKIIISDDPRKSLVKFKLGPMAGEKVTQNNFINDHSVDPTSKIITKVFYAPDGLVYKWKEGIGIFTYAGNSIALNDPNKVGTPNTYAEPFAGQDIMNVISLLITGTPYNYATYFKASQNDGGYGNDPQSLQNASYSFINALKTDLSKSNALWGNFVPFKNLVVSEQSFAKALTAQFTVTQQNDALNAQLKELSDLNNKLVLAGVSSILGDTSGTGDPNAINLKSQADVLQKSADALVNKIQESIKQLQTSGPDTSYDTLSALDAGNTQKSVSDSSIRKYLRRQVNYLTRRMSYDVRGNTDKNLFIVDDTYDKDYDIAAYNSNLTDGIKLYNSDFTSVRQKIESVAQLLDLEVFCDTQGHIRVRPPQYNRMPSSVFYRMMYLKQALNVQVFPQFLSDFFLDQIDTLKTRIEIIEDQIRLDCAVLGHKANLSSDDDAVSFIQNNEVSAGTGDVFDFLSFPSGTIVDIDTLISQANPENPGATLTSAQGQASSTKVVVSNSSRYAIILNSLSAQKSSAAGLNTNNISALQSNEVVNTLISRIQTKSGQPLSVQDFIVTNDAGFKGVSVPSGQQVDVFKVTQQLTDLTTERQKVIKLFYQTVKNAAEFKSLDDNNNNGVTSSAMLTPGVFGNENIPEVYSHMIEDEGYDDYGPGSGSRFIIKRSQIKSISISARPPTHTAVEVKGVLNPFAPNALPNGLNAFPDGGNGLVTAMAVDYDMWRNYGFKEPAVLNVPFLSDPISQCGPYAAILLSRNRKNILGGSVTISGNEYMQPGEVVFLQDRSMLFYVDSVRHSFTYGNTFTTTLELSYGHTPGDYIPTVMDVIGKLIYANKDVAAMSVQRQESSSNDINLGSLIRDPNSDHAQPINDGNASSPTTSTSTFNTQVINNILYTAAYLINSNNSKGNNVKVKVDLRCYYDDDTGEVNLDLQDFRTAIMSALTSISDGPTQPMSTGKSNGNKPLPASAINIVDVSLDNDKDNRSPSQKAMDSARRMIKVASTSSSSTSPTLEGDKLRKSLFSYIVDCWLSIESVPPQESNGS